MRDPDSRHAPIRRIALARTKVAQFPIQCIGALWRPVADMRPGPGGGMWRSPAIERSVFASGRPVRSPGVARRSAGGPRASRLGGRCGDMNVVATEHSGGDRCRGSEHEPADGRGAAVEEQADSGAGRRGQPRAAKAGVNAANGSGTGVVGSPNRRPSPPSSSTRSPRVSDRSGWRAGRTTTPAPRAPGPAGPAPRPRQPSAAAPSACRDRWGRGSPCRGAGSSNAASTAWPWPGAGTSGRDVGRGTPRHGLAGRARENPRNGGCGGGVVSGRRGCPSEPGRPGCPSRPRTAPGPTPAG